ncbi:flagellar hook-associated protein FlgL [Motiliproteus sp. SC1-56]|uniref:flagellar hook-associated protein FlgL n=1 Tax=Motiliproteus sp. SC1-56 TaxID=2799565 RepID=UPI001A8E75B8|nr:flagellar hook-associated protein FlgL [Motiliproteus sp. SC1-56]
MRISTLQTFNNAVDQMQQNQTRLAELQQQISSGKKLLRPSDDPIAAAQILKLNREVARLDKFEDNIDVTNRRLQLEELTLDQINTATDRIRELTIQAGNGTLTNEDRGFLAAEVRQLQDQIMGLMNTQDASGEYLFAGSLGFEKPFTRNGDNTFSYNGDDGQRFIQVAPEFSVASTDSGRSAFQVIPDEIGVGVLGAAGDVANVAVSVTDPDDGTFAAFSEANGDLVVEFSNVTGTSYDYKVYDTATPRNELVSVTGAVPGVPETFGGLTLDYTGSSDATVTLRAEQSRHSILTTAEELITALETPISSDLERDEYFAALDRVFEGLDISQTANIQLRTELGARQNSVESSADANADLKLFTESALSQLEDLDYAEALSEFALQETALQAAQSTFARVSQLSLFNFL